MTNKQFKNYVNQMVEKNAFGEKARKISYNQVKLIAGFIDNYSIKSSPEWCVWTGKGEKYVWVDGSLSKAEKLFEVLKQLSR